MNKKRLVKIIIYFIIAPWKLLPYRFKCPDCNHEIFWGAKVCGNCLLAFDEVGWDKEKRYCFD